MKETGRVVFGNFMDQDETFGEGRVCPASFWGKGRGSRGARIPG